MPPEHDLMFQPPERRRRHHQVRAALGAGVSEAVNRRGAGSSGQPGALALSAAGEIPDTPRPEIDLLLVAAAANQHRAVTRYVPVDLPAEPVAEPLDQVLGRRVE